MYVRTYDLFMYVCVCMYVCMYVCIRKLIADAEDRFRMGMIEVCTYVCMYVCVYVCMYPKTNC